MNWTGQSVGRCPRKGCRHSTFTVGTLATGDCPDHGRYRLEEVIGEHVPSVKCGARCQGAIGPVCDCSCGGMNHGRNHARD